MKKGFTLVELIVVILLMGMTLALGYRLLFYTQNTFERGEDRAVVQQDVNYASDLITHELQKATDVKILASLPAVFDNNKRYLYVDPATGNLKQVINGTTRDALGISNSDVNFSSIVFSRNASNPDILAFQVNAISGSQSFNTDSQIDVLNLPSTKDIDIADISALGNGGVICYSFASNAKSLDVFAVRTEHNSGFPEPFQIDNPPNNIQWWVTQGINVGNLKVYFEYTGTSIKVNGTEQVSGVTANNFNNPVVYTITAEDGSTANYTVEIKHLLAPPEAAGVKFFAHDTDGTVSAPFESFVLTGEYTYVPNGNGPEGVSQYKWQVSNTEAGAFSDISGKTTKQFKPTGLVGKWVRFGVRPISASGVNGQFFYSSPQQVLPDIGNLFWRHFINDLYFMMRPVSEQPVGFSPSVKVRKDYAVESKMDPNRDALNLTISYPNSAGSTVASGGSHIYKDMTGYVNDLDSFSVTVDAQVKSGSGYGVLLYGSITENVYNKDSGFMFQFDPGWNGFLIRKIENGKHDPWWRTFGMTKNLSMADTQTGHYDYGRYTPQEIRNDQFIWATDSTAQNITQWQQRYKTELVMQRQLDGSFIFKATVITTDGKRSNEMWFGSFGTYTADLYNRNGTKTGTKSYYGKQLPKFPTTGGTILGLRTWDAGGSSYKTEFQEILLGPGFSMNVTKAEYVSNKQIKVKFDQKLDTTTRIDYIKHGIASIASASVANDPIDGQVLLINLNIPATETELRNGAESKLNINRFGVRQQYAGDVKIPNGLMFDIEKDSTLPVISSIVRNSTYTSRVVLTFSEDVSSTSASVKSNYILSRTGYQTINPDSVNVNGNSVTLYFSRNISTTYDKLTVNNVQDIAGNVMEGKINQNIN